MSSWSTWVTAVLIVFWACGSIAFGQASGQDGSAVAWYESMSEGSSYYYLREHDRALQFYEEALPLAPSDEHKADTLLRIAEVYEGMFRRSDAIATYERVLAECQGTPHAPRVYFRLGELHTSITLLPPWTSDAVEAEVLAEMIPSNSIPYSEKAVSLGPALGKWTLSSKIYLARLYRDTDREQESWSILHELANIDVYDVTDPDYAGPYTRMNAAEETHGERLDDTRVHALVVRRSARQRLVWWSTVPDDLGQSILNLRALQESYAGTEVESWAKQQEALLAEQVKQQELTNIVDQIMDEGLVNE